jgi:hypothetical protein
VAHAIDTDDLASIIRRPEAAERKVIRSRLAAPQGVGAAEVLRCRNLRIQSGSFLSAGNTARKWCLFVAAEAGGCAWFLEPSVQTWSGMRFHA